MTETVTTLEQFNTYPNGAVFRDSDGWTHTKINDGETPHPSGNGILPASTYVDPDGHPGTFYRPWDYGLIALEITADKIAAGVITGDIITADKIAASAITADKILANTVMVTAAAKSGTRPLIDFSSDSHATARQYAAAINSRTLLTLDDRQTLNAVAEGEQVDAYALNRALLASMRTGLTRFGQSMVRREHGKKVAHLGYIVQAVLENHADGLPAYAEGERSRKIEALEAGIEEIRASRDALADRLEVAERAAEVAGLSEKALVDAATEVDKAREALVERTGQRDTLGSILDYALEQMDDEQKARVFGYWDGITA